MRALALTLGIVGATLTIGAAIYLWRMDPTAQRYRLEVYVDGDVTEGLRHLVIDQGKAAAVTALGATLQLLGLLASFLGEPT